MSATCDFSSSILLLSFFSVSSDTLSKVTGLLDSKLFDVLFEPNFRPTKKHTIAIIEAIITTVSKSIIYCSNQIIYL